MGLSPDETWNPLKQELPMGSLYSVMPMHIKYRKLVHQQIHEELSMVNLGGCDPGGCACVCMQAVCLHMGVFAVC